MEKEFFKSFKDKNGFDDIKETEEEYFYNSRGNSFFPSDQNKRLSISNYDYKIEEDSFNEGKGDMEEKELDKDKIIIEQKTVLNKIELKNSKKKKKEKLSKSEKINKLLKQQKSEPVTKNERHSKNYKNIKKEVLKIKNQNNNNNAKIFQKIEIKELNINNQKSDRKRLYLKAEKFIKNRKESQDNIYKSKKSKAKSVNHLSKGDHLQIKEIKKIKSKKTKAKKINEIKNKLQKSIKNSNKIVEGKKQDLKIINSFKDFKKKLCVTNSGLYSLTFNKNFNNEFKKNHSLKMLNEYSSDDINSIIFKKKKNKNNFKKT